MTDAMSSRELVSVIMPAYNAAAFIGKTLACALSQTHRALEVIVVDDGSTDNTAQIVEAVASRDARVCLLRQPNRGVAAARNLGIDQSHGAFVAPLDADDLWHPDKIARQVAAMREGGRRVGMVYAWSSIIDEAGQILWPSRSVPRHVGDVYPFLIIYNFVGNASAPLLRRDCVLEAGGYDSSLRGRGGEGCEDLMLYLAVAEQYEVALVPEFLVGYRMRLSSMSNNIRRMQRGHDLIIQTIRSRHPELPSRIFRWSESFSCFYLGRRSLRCGGRLSAALLFARALARDPGFLFEPPFRSAIASIATRLLLSTRAIDRQRQTRTAFLDFCTQPGAIAVPETGVFGRRRHAFLESLRSAAGHRNKATPRFLNVTADRPEPMPTVSAHADPAASD